MSAEYAAIERREDILALLLRLKGALWFTGRLFEDEGGVRASGEYRRMAEEIGALAAEVAREGQR